jgi:hypothetical protein
MCSNKASNLIKPGQIPAPLVTSSSTPVAIRCTASEHKFLAVSATATSAAASHLRQSPALTSAFDFGTLLSRHLEELAMAGTLV